MAAGEVDGKKTAMTPEVKIDLPMSSFGLSALWSRVDIAPDTCLVSAERLASPPSLQDGMSTDTEIDLRFLGCELIQSAAILLKLPQVAAATGQMLYQRYFYSKSFVRSDFEHVAMACVSLASKIEEAPRRLRDVVNVFHHLEQLHRLRRQESKSKRLSPMILDERYISWKNLVIKAERRVLKELGFCVHVKHPHKLIQAYMMALGQLENKTLLQRAWNYINDGLRTDIFLRYNPETISCATIFLAARVLQVPLPSEPAPWWELFDVKEQDVFQIAHIILTIYNRPKSPNWSRLEKTVGELKATLQDKQKTKLGSETPNAAISNDKQSPSDSRPASPVEKKKRGKSGDRDRVNGEVDKKRARTRTPPVVLSSPNKKTLPKRYTGRGSLNPSAQGKDGKSRRSGEEKKKRHRNRSTSPNRPLNRHHSSESNLAAAKNVKEKKSGRTRSRSRERQRMATKEREREVRLTLGKRKKSPVTPEDFDRHQKKLR